MKIKNTGLYFILIMGLLLGDSCKKKSEEVKPVYSISAYDNNEPWNVNSVTSTLVIDNTHGDRIVDITTTSGTKTITMEFFDYGSGNGISGGSHTSPTDAYFNYASGSGSGFTTSSGAVTVTENDASAKTLSATFDFIVKDNSTGVYRHISNGAITKVSYGVIYR